MAERLKRLRPISYRYTTEPNATHYGLIAEEVEKVMPELVVRDGKNRPESVQYIELVPLLLNEVQRQRQIIRRQAETVGILERRQRSFEARLHKLTTLLAATQRAALTPSTTDEVR